MAQATGAPVDVTAVRQSFGANTVLDGIDLHVGSGEVVALLGPSGCGKTTLLRLIAGLLRPSRGQIRIAGDIVADAATGSFRPPERRSIGMVFQDYALWPHMTVARNVRFPLDTRRLPPAERRERTREALRLVGLEHMADRPPGTLSGGQQQRVALARAIVSRPAVILFDEPLSNLDRELRESLVVDIATLVRSLGLTAVYVTHDHAEAFAIADRVAILRDGRILQIDAPERLVAAPRTVEVADFLKLGLVLPARRVADGLAVNGDGQVLRTPAGFPAAAPEDVPDGHLFVPRGALRPVPGGAGSLRGTAIHSLFRGEGYSVRLRIDPTVTIEVASDVRLDEGADVGIAVAWERARWFPAAEPGRRLDRQTTPSSITQETP